MNVELRQSLDELHLLMDNWNRGKIATEELFLDDMLPIVLKLKDELEKPQPEQTTIDNSIPNSGPKMP